jgi:hypothetical protein
MSDIEKELRRECDYPRCTNGRVMDNAYDEPRDCNICHGTGTELEIPPQNADQPLLVAIRMLERDGTPQRTQIAQELRELVGMVKAIQHDHDR